MRRRSSCPNLLLQRKPLTMLDRRLLANQMRAQKQAAMDAKRAQMAAQKKQRIKELRLQTLAKDTQLRRQYSVEDGQAHCKYCQEWIPEMMFEEHTISHPTQIRQRIWLGNASNSQDLEVITRCGITHILNCTKEIAFAPHVSDITKGCKRIAIQDKTCETILDYVTEVCQYIEQCLSDSKSHVILVHCREGRSRSVSFLCTYLMWKERLSFHAALSEIRSKRHIVLPNSKFYSELLVFDRQMNMLSPNTKKKKFGLSNRSLTLAKANGFPDCSMNAHTNGMIIKNEALGNGKKYSQRPTKAHQGNANSATVTKKIQAPKNYNKSAPSPPSHSHRSRTSSVPVKNRHRNKSSKKSDNNGSSGGRVIRNRNCSPRNIAKHEMRENSSADMHPEFDFKLNFNQNLINNRNFKHDECSNPMMHMGTGTGTGSGGTRNYRSTGGSPMESILQSPNTKENRSLNRVFEEMDLDFQPKKKAKGKKTKAKKKKKRRSNSMMDVLNEVFPVSNKKTNMGRTEDNNQINTNTNTNTNNNNSSNNNNNNGKRRSNSVSQPQSLSQKPPKSGGKSGSSIKKKKKKKSKKSKKKNKQESDMATAIQNMF